MSRKPGLPATSPTPDVTGAELAVLEALWDAGSATVRQLADRVYPGGTASEYATVQKLLQRLTQKRWVQRIRGSAPIAFEARMGREALVARHIEEVVDRLCAGSITPLLSHLARRELSASDRAELSALLDTLQQRPAKARRPR